MVHLSLMRLVRTRGPDRWWRRKYVFDQTQHFYGRRRNVYSIAVRAMMKAWKSMKKGRVERRRVMRQLWNMRIGAAAVEHGMRYSEFIGSLPKHNIFLDRKILSQLAITEPKTFKCLVDLAKIKKEEDNIAYLKDHPERLDRMLTQDDLLADALDRLKLMGKSDNVDNVATTTGGRETEV